MRFNSTYVICLAMLLCTSSGSPEPDPEQVFSSISLMVVAWLESSTISGISSLGWMGVIMVVFPSQEETPDPEAPVLARLRPDVLNRGKNLKKERWTLGKTRNLEL